MSPLSSSKGRPCDTIYYTTIQLTITWLNQGASNSFHDTGRVQGQHCMVTAPKHQQKLRERDAMMKPTKDICDVTDPKIYRVELQGPRVREGSYRCLGAFFGPIRYLGH
jgi:hypothetical protein